MLLVQQSFEIFVQDNGGTDLGGENTSDTFTVEITINPVNDKPGFTAGNDITVLEDSPTYTENNWAVDIIAGPDNKSEQTMQFQLDIDQPGLFETAPAIQPDGTLTFTPASQAFGTARVEVILFDDGGIANGGENQSSIQTFRNRNNPR